MPRESLDYVRMHWDQERFAEVGCMPDMDCPFRKVFLNVFGADCREGEEWKARGSLRRSRSYLCQHTYAIICITAADNER